MQRLLLWLTSLVVRFYYRTERHGARVPTGGPVLLVANHPNGLVDPVVLARSTNRPVRFLGKAPLFEMPVLGTIVRGLGTLPVYRSQDGADTALNDRTFEAVFASLRKGDAICMFPEGRSHSEPELQRLKTGAARMALGAERQAGYELGVRIVPVGLTYRAKRRFRSLVGVWVGDPIDAHDVRELDQQDDREAVRVLTERVADGLRQVTLSLDRWEDLPLLELAERIWRPEEGPRLFRIHRFAEGVRALRSRDPERVDRLSERISAYRERLQRIGLGVEDLEASYRPWPVVRYVLRALSILVVALPLGLAGGLFWFLPYRLVPLLAHRMRPERDIYATVQILAGVVVLPIWWIAAIVAAGLLWGTWAAVSVALLAPLLGLEALRFHEWRRETREDVGAFFVLVSRRRLHALLLRERDQIAEEIEALRAELAP